ncbi:hypothetical protein [Colwellia sp. 20A7]|uniref:hypothetical protein n=1 Tax=Colwellia sp. 20A7 TaxID=2689569 RepID=UPI00135A0139|nr:hypothetical protein [Colwellia sp. 20A7]
MTNHAQDIKLSLSTFEFSFIIDYQLANKDLLKKLLSIQKELMITRPNFKRVTFCLNLSMLDKLIANISNEANKLSNSADKQLLLDSLFGKLASKYNNLAY